MPKVYIPSALRPFLDNKGIVDLPGETVDHVLKTLVERYPGVRNHLFEENGKVRNFVNIFVNDEDVRFLDKEQTKVSDQDEISIVPSVAGGAESTNGAVKLSNEEILRYNRHIILPEVALDGQKKLKAASILLIGAGGLGSPLAMYLAAAGIGRLGLVDFDVVDASNLQRQVIHKTANIGKSKLVSAKEFIAGVNPNVEVESYETAFTSENAMEIARDYDIVIDGTDNFPTRYLVNDVCVLLGKPNVYGSIFRFEGQASVFAPIHRGPCYRCLYPEPPPPGLVPSCAEGGVLGVLPGVIGVIQATEAVKLILRKGDTLIGRLLLYDALAMQFREVRLRKDPDCPICGENRTIHELIDYNEFCGIPGVAHEQQLEPAIEITATDLATKIATDTVFLLDIREPYEWQLGFIESATLIPLGDLPTRLDEIDRTKEIIAYCRTGVRSLQALEFLKNAGFTSVRHLKGGIHAWSREIDSSIPQY
ncbi:MAG: molybdopterin-synthase adenylyltransferase MoeB [bacterium]